MIFQEAYKLPDMVRNKISILWQDINAFIRNHGHIRPVIAILSLALTGGMVSMMFFSSKIEKPDPEIIFVQNINGARSDTEIQSKNLEDQKKLEARQEESRKRWREFGHVLGYSTQN
ncbi:hypothetical protein FBY51_0460 [Zymomonas mobilis]|uniref:hypothetical protein n=1 Tax=Zymomonas mobilis TaxID=542 RepID=UPI00026D8718|nr:hypothetical protein [Zymomonas mobilis]AFN56682.1 hypothetical protein ZZ6_0788 [Zymomonas mobilis subsp. mobilis ATCC 29191]TQK77887.1 hypothetical protein FBY53_0530 [Zymomonas mobilis]TQL15468.1 hypothetical protein FBY51_0460 [Zymomonas mobilis]GEB87036.1 hypothetical protein ZMO01_03760 [Zymomonas mobilis subsp. mobilis]